MFRALALWEYTTEEEARQQLLKVIEQGNHSPGPYMLQYAINLRKREIQWPFLYIPLFANLLLSISLIISGLHSPKPLQLPVSVAFIACLIFIFRNTGTANAQKPVDSFMWPGIPFPMKYMEKEKGKDSRRHKSRRSRFSQVNQTSSKARNLTWN
jgi:hypothetical protein